VAAAGDALASVDVGVDMSRLFSAQAIPLFLVFLILLAYMLTERLWLGRIRAFLSKFVSCCKAQEQPEDLPPFFRSIPDDALDRSLNSAWTAPELREEYLNEKAFRVFWKVRDKLYDGAVTDIDKEAARLASRRAVYVFFFLSDKARTHQRTVKEVVAAVTNRAYNDRARIKKELEAKAAGDATPAADSSSEEESAYETPDGCGSARLRCRSRSWRRIWGWWRGWPTRRASCPSRS